MKTVAITGAIAALAAGAIATPSFAADPCHQRQHNRGTTGAVIGGLAGAMIGSNIPHHHGARTGGAILGGLAGAAVGNSIGRQSTKCDNYAYYNYNGRYYDQQAYNNSYYNGYYNGYPDGRNYDEYGRPYYYPPY